MEVFIGQKIMDLTAGKPSQKFNTHEKLKRSIIINYSVNLKTKLLVLLRNERANQVEPPDVLESDSEGNEEEVEVELEDENESYTAPEVEENPMFFRSALENPGAGSYEDDFK